MPTPRLTPEQFAQTKKVLDENGWNISRSAMELGISRATLQHRIKFIGDRRSERRFTVHELPSSLPTIDELLARRTEQGDRSLAADEAKNLIPVDLHIDGPIGIWIWGDPHIDDDGCNLRLLREHVELARHPAIFSLHIGDLANFFERIGKLARLCADQSSSAREAWMLVEWLLNQHEHLAVVLGNHDCLDMETEALTKRGWVKFDDLMFDDEVMSLVAKTGKWEWAPILAKVEREHDGEFVRIHGSPVDMRVTSNHRVLHRKFSSYKNEYGALEYRHASEMPQKFSIPVSAHRATADIDIEDNWLTIAGWLLTDGSIHEGVKDTHRSQVVFYQSKECPSLEIALANLGLEHRVKIRERNIKEVCGKRLLNKPKPQREYRLGVVQSERVLAVIPEKGKLPSWAFDLSDRQFDVLLDAIVEGDGVWDGNRPDLKKCAAVHGTKEFLDSLQICAIQHGWRAHISVAREKDYRLNLCRKTEWQAHKYASVKTETGKGRVWCLTVPHTNFMVRRNGKPFFTGNCWNGHGNPIEWILRHQGALSDAHGVRLALRHPCGAVTRGHFRHDFSGKSIYRIDHGLRRELAFGYRDHLLVAGHLHSGSDSAVVAGDGMVSQLVRVSGYKQVDGYAKQLGLPPAKIHPSALCIIDPREPDTSRARVWCAPTVETGVKCLDTLRAGYEQQKKKRK